MRALFVVQLPDRSIHYARVGGYVRTLCGRDRVTNADVREDHPVPECGECRAVAAREGYEPVEVA